MKLSVQDLNSHYGPAHILFDIALEVGDGEVVALLGRNGAGKSTTFRSIIGLVEQRTGRIVFEGRDISDAPTHAIVSICCSPPLMRPPWRPRISPRLGNSANNFLRSQVGAFGLDGWRPTSRFSSTVRSVKIRRSSGT